MIEDKEHQWHDGFPVLPKGLTVIPWLVWAVLIGLAIAAVFYSAKVKADPLFEGEGQGVKIVLYNEPCKLDAVSNLPYRLTWEEKGQISEGCFAPRKDVDAIVAYFASDKSVALIPVSIFHKVIGA